MKVRSKIFWAFILVTLPTIMIINLIFGLFFQNLSENQENLKVATIRSNISSNIAEEESKYIGTVNDWSHWDDTYNYLSGNNSTFPDKNLNADTFSTLDLSFIVFTNSDGFINEKKFYDFNKGKFTEFPANFSKDIKNIINLSKLKADTFGIYQVGNDYYFIVSSDVTDSLQQKPSNGKMIIGKLIDKSIIASIEENTGGSIISINAMRNLNVMGSKRGNESAIMRSEFYSKNEDSIIMEFIIPNSIIENSAALFTVAMPRDLCISEMKQISYFALISTSVLAAIFFLVYKFLGKRLTTPFLLLKEDSGNIDFKENELNKIREQEKSEFAYLRNTLNSILEKTEGEQNKVRESEERLWATLISVGDGVITVGIDAQVQFMNPVAEKLTGWKQKDAFNKPIETVFCIKDEYSNRQVDSPISLVFSTEDIVKVSNHTLLVSKKGAERPIEDTAAPIKDKSGNLIGCVLVFRDISDKKEKQKRIEYLSYHDQLTGLYNRSFFEEELKRLDTKRNLPISFVYADIDGLKIINDAFGHQEGDHLIQQVANALKSECRADDIIVRTGGDEFIILLPKTDSVFAEKLVDRIKEKIDATKIMDINLSISFGWETKYSMDQPALEVLKSSEDFMYNKKILSNFSKRSEVIKSILNSLHVKSEKEGLHSERVSLICESIGKAYELNDDTIKELKLAGQLHDIGKIAVDEKILNNPGKLTESEWVQLKKHPETGYRLLGTSSEFYNISEYVLAHHERWDGTGYPRGLKGEDIQWKARIISIADAYDGMTSERYYKTALSVDEAIAEIKKNSGTQFDPDIARTFIEKVLGAQW